MQSNAKSLALIRDLADRLAVRMPLTAAGLNSQRQGFDANNWPILVLSHNANEAAGQPVVWIRISNVDAVSKDIFGNQTFAYAPHKLELAYELQATPNIGNSFASHSDVLTAEYEAQSCGCEFQIKEIAQGTAVTEASVNAATPVVDLQPLYWPTKSV